MNDGQLLRYSRHILLDEIGIEGQERIVQRDKEVDLRPGSPEASTFRDDDRGRRALGGRSLRALPPRTTSGAGCGCHRLHG